MVHNRIQIIMFFDSKVNAAPPKPMTPIEIMFATQAALKETYSNAVTNNKNAIRKEISEKCRQKRDPFCVVFLSIPLVTGASIDRLGYLAGVGPKNEQRFEDRFEAEEPPRDYSNAPSRDVKINVLRG